jgi:hypothetical protein
LRALPCCADARRPRLRHSKVIESHRRLLIRLLDAVLPIEAIDTSVTGFAARYGFVEPARRARLRGDASILGAPVTGDCDVTWDIATLAALSPSSAGVDELLIVENQTSFLAAPSAPGRLVLWGAGYGADELLAALPWRGAVAVRYWGDIETHGFVILAQVRAAAPHTTSVLMDTGTLLAHRTFWTQETSPRTDPLPALTEQESQACEALRSGRYGPRVRLEQEFSRYDLVLDVLLATDMSA